LLDDSFERLYPLLGLQRIFIFVKFITHNAPPKELIYYL
jgi:hypothetical protein